MTRLPGFLHSIPPLRMKYLPVVLLFAAICGLASLGDARFDVAGSKRESGRISQKPAADRQAEPNDLVHTPPAAVRRWYQNFSRFRGDGSCVQCSIGINGVRRDCLPAETLLWDTIYGPAILGGSDPTRVAAYCRDRNIPIFNVTGDATLKWDEYAADTGRGAAIWFGEMHFQTLMGRDKAAGKWFVCNNNWPQRIDEYSDADYRRIRRQSGLWIVVIDGPAVPPAPTPPTKS